MTAPNPRAGRLLSGPADNPADELRTAADSFDAEAQGHRDQAAALRTQAAAEDQAAVAATARGRAYRAAATKVAAQ